MAIARFINPWVFKRNKQRQRLAELRQRDGDHCRRCRRPMSFDLPPGHDQAPTIQPIGPRPKGGGGALDDLCLCHVRCNRMTVDNTVEVQERMRLKAEDSKRSKRSEPTRRRAKAA